MGDQSEEPNRLDTPSATEAANLYVEVNPHILAGQIPNQAGLSIVEGKMDRSTLSTGRFFPALKPNEDGSGVSEDPGNPPPRAEARKPIDVMKFFMFSHPFS